MSGNPLANWIINNQYPELPQPQATADEFGATLPNGNGDENMTVFPNFIGQIRGFGPDYNPKQIKYRILYNNGETNVYGPWITLPLPDYEDMRGIEMFVAVEEVETENPNPPSVTELPKGTLGVDVSAHQGVFDWDTVVANGVKFAIVRSSNGLGSSSTDSNGRDLQLKRNATELTNLGIPWAIYHYLQPGQSISQQSALVNGILAELDIWGTFPIPGMINGRMMPAIFADVEDSTLTTEQVKEFMDGLNLTAGIYTGKGVWDIISASQDVWWSDVFLWCAAYGANDGKLPNWTSPGLPRGWFGIDIWQYTSLGGNEVGLPVDDLDLNSAGPYAPNITPPIPPPVTLVDVASYFVPDGQYGRKIVMKTGNGTQPMQLEKRPSDVILRKGDGNWIDGIRYQDSEQWRVKDGQIQKGKDTSDAGNGGRDGYDLGWAEWIPQFVEVGKTYHSTPTVKRFNRTNNCQVYSESQANDYLTIKAIIPTWISPANSDIVLNDVLVIEWRSGTSDLSVPPNEVYYFAKNISYVGWGSHFIVEIADGQAPLTGKLDCGM